MEVLAQQIKEEKKQLKRKKKYQESDEKGY
jgi:hypothetical protein